MSRNLLLKNISILLLIILSGTFAYSQSETEQPKQADRPLKITKNVPASYSGEARARQIEGWIKLRITFLDTGRIGDIFYVDESDPEKNLTKYGLLKNSYEAAKKVEFLPAIKDGKPVTVTKLLLYSFDLGRRPTFQVGRRP